VEPIKGNQHAIPLDLRGEGLGYEAMSAQADSRVSTRILIL